MRIEHVAVAVEDLDAAIGHFRDAWSLETSHRERVVDQGVEEAMLPLGDGFLQLISPVGGDSAVARFLERRGEGLHHIAIEVDDLPATLERLKSSGVSLIDESPRVGGRGHSVAFVHPRSSLGVLVELVQSSVAPE